MKTVKKLLAIVLVLTSLSVSAQKKAKETEPFQSAVANKKVYKVVYQLNTDDDKKITSTLKNIKNALQDPRLQGKLKVELVVHGTGYMAFKKNSAYEAQLLELKKAGVWLAQCENTLRERKVDKSELYDFISYVPTANGELIIRQADGWGIIHP